MGKAERFEDFHARLREFQVRQFAQRVSPMQPVEQGDAVQVVLMESWLDDELRCEALHKDSQCSVEVTHLMRFCTGRIHCCKVHRDVKVAQMTHGNCYDCGRPAAKCWALIPV